MEKIKYIQIMKKTSQSMAFPPKKAIFATLSCIVVTTFFLASIQAPTPEAIFQNDYDRLIDIPFKFLHVPKCNEKNNFLVLVHTSPSNIERRTLLRETWANKNESGIDVFFLTGRVNDITQQTNLENEAKKYNNFIIGDFLDTYRNLTYKHVMGLKYIFYHCPNIEYVVKSDDDVFVNTHVLKSFFQLYTKSFRQNKNILCSKRVGHPVLREGKWAVSNEEYSTNSYPPHCLGFAIIYPRNSIKLLYPVAQKTKYFWIDDVHVSGTLAKDAGVEQTDINSLIMNNDEFTIIIEKKYNIEMRPVLFGPPEMGQENLKSVHGFLRKHGRKASVIEYLTE